MEIQQLKEAIFKELPILIQNDESVRKYILKICKPEFADRTETESRFDRILNELKADREESRRKWDENQKKWDENRNDSDKRFESLTRRLDNTISSLAQDGECVLKNLSETDFRQFWKNPLMLRCLISMNLMMKELFSEDRIKWNWILL